MSVKLSSLPGTAILLVVVAVYIVTLLLLSSCASEPRAFVGVGYFPDRSISLATDGHDKYRDSTSSGEIDDGVFLFGGMSFSLAAPSSECSRTPHPPPLSPASPYRCREEAVGPSEETTAIDADGLSTSQEWAIAVLGLLSLGSGGGLLYYRTRRKEGNGNN